MSSEFDTFFEEFLNEDFDTGVGDGYQYSVDTEIQQDGSDFQMWDLPAGNFENFDYEARQANALDLVGWAPLGTDVAPDEQSFSNSTHPPNLTATTLANTDVQPQDAFTCPWIHCSVTWYSAAGQAEGHRNQHSEEILKQWSGASTCPWPKCTSKATFKTRSSLKTHLLNVHVSPLICDEPQCSYKKPFGKQYELDRHVSTAHGEIRKYKCPIDACEASVTGFARKDKLVKHIREEHENVRCPYNHCFATVPATREEEHIRVSHGPYECAMGQCGRGIASHFSYESLKHHLRVAHGIDYWIADWAKLLASGKTLTAKDSVLHFGKPPRDCATCL